MTAIDDAIASVNRVWREFKRYTGDGLPGEPTNAPLPVGDPSSGIENPKKASIRAMLNGALGAVKDALDDIAEGAVPDNGVSTAKVQDEAITEPKHATGGVSTRALAAGAATLAKIGDDAKSDFRLVDPNGALPRLWYNGPSSVRAALSSFPMGGFWYRGRRTNDRARVLPVSDPIFDWTTDYGAGSIKLESWQALFLCAQAADSVAVPKIMPYLRVHSVAGSVVTLNKAGEGIGAQDAASAYGWANDELIGAKCLVISEAGNFTNARVTTVTDNTTTTVTLADIGSIGGTFSGAPSLDWLLIAPPGYDLDEFAWVGDFYADTAEVRNTYWGGSSAKGKMIYVLDPSSHRTGAVAAPGALINTGGYISPLATAVHLDSSCVLSTAGTGGYAEYFDVDGGNHVVQSTYLDKTGSGSLSVVFDGIMVPFLYHGRFFYSNAGATAAARINGQLNITGWEY